MHVVQYLPQTGRCASIRSTVPAAFSLPSVGRHARAPQQQTLVAPSSRGHLCNAAGPHTEDRIQQLDTLQGHQTSGHAAATTITASSSSSSSTVKTADTPSNETQQHGDNDPGWLERIDNDRAPQELPPSVEPRRRRIPIDEETAADIRDLEHLEDDKSEGPYANIRSRGLPRRSGLAPGVKRTGKPVEVLIARQLRDLMKNPIPGIQVEPDEDNVMIWHAQVEGPAGSPYEGGRFKVDVIFDNDFPGTQPKLQFLTNIWHPNISGSYICVTFGTNNNLRKGSKGTQQVRSAACVLIGLQMLLSTPSARNCLSSAGHQLRKHPDLFVQQARDWTKKYAMDGCEAEDEGREL